jgi:hypothetical protein
MSALRQSMNRARGAAAIFASLVLGLGTAIPVAVAAEPEELESPQGARALPDPSREQPVQQGAQQDAPHARVSFVEGDYFVRGPFDSEEQNLVLNSIIREGDIVRAGENTLAEIELPNATFLRMSSNGIVRVDRVDPIEITVIEGSAYFSQGPSGQAAALTTSQGGVSTNPGSLTRIEATRVDQSTTVRVVSGDVRATCNGGESRIAGGATLTCGAGAAQPGQWDPSHGDSFDHWNREREDLVRRAATTPSEVAGRYEGMHDLEGHGNWVYVDNGWYWQPTGIDVGWRPYYDGYWSWYGAWGWTWIPSAPWGYVTHHYGRWVHRMGFGWVWSPAPVWAGAWVVWGAFGGYLGWAPCDFWGRPVGIYARYSWYDPYVWSFGHARYFYEGGGNWRHHERFEHGRHEVFTLTHEQLSSLRATPVRNPSVSLAPRTASLEGADALAAHNAGSARGEFLQHMVEHSHAVPGSHLDARGGLSATPNARSDVHAVSGGGNEIRATHPIANTSPRPAQAPQAPTHGRATFNASTPSHAFTPQQSTPQPRSYVPQAQSYRAPVRSYSAPVYSAPRSYSAPSYNAPRSFAPHSAGVPYRYTPPSGSFARPSAPSRSFSAPARSGGGGRHR